MPGKAAAKEVEKAADDVGTDAYEMVHLDIGRVDGVDDPAHGRQFLLIKSAAGVIEQDDETEADDLVQHDAIAEAAEKCLVSLAQDKTPLTAVQVEAIKSLAGALGMPEDDIEIVPIPQQQETKKPARTHKSKGGTMAGTKARVRKAEVDADAKQQTQQADDEELEETVDQLNQADDEEDDADDDEQEDAVATSADDNEDDADEEGEEEGQKQPVSTEKARGNNGKVAGPGQKMPTKPAGKNAAKAPTKASARKSANAELETLVANAVANAMAGPFEALTAAISELAQPVQKSARRPVSQQAKGQDDVRKSATPEMGAGLFTNVVFPE